MYKVIHIFWYIFLDKTNFSCLEGLSARKVFYAETTDREQVLSAKHRELFESYTLHWHLEKFEKKAYFDIIYGLS